MLETHAGDTWWTMTEKDISKLSPWHTRNLRKVLCIFWPNQHLQPAITLSDQPRKYRDHHYKKAVEMDWTKHAKRTGLHC